MLSMCQASMELGSISTPDFYLESRLLLDLDMGSRLWVRIRMWDPSYRFGSGPDHRSSLFVKLAPVHFWNWI